MLAAAEGEAPLMRRAQIAKYPCASLRISAMRLTTIEGDFLKRLSLEPWTSPPVFDHGLVERMVREDYVTTQATGHGVHYENTD